VKTSPRFQLTTTAAITAAAVGFIAISSQSLWIDEANSAVKASAAAWGEFIARMFGDRNSDLQMPFYMAMLWTWEKAFGNSEFALRAMNLPLFVTAIAVVSFSLRVNRRASLFYTIISCTSAFVWAYLDEARPYILQFLAATLVMVPLANTSNRLAAAEPAVNVRMFALGIILLCGSSLIGVVFASVFVPLYAAMALSRESWHCLIKRPDIRHALLWGTPLLLSLGAYYLWTLLIGAKASGVGQTNAFSVAFSAYEILGFAGLGPGRSELRGAPFESLGTHIPTVGLHAAALALVVVTFMTAQRTKSGITKWAGAIAAAVLLASLLVIMAGVFGEFRVVGRHLTPTIPFVFLLGTFVLDSLWTHGSLWPRSVVAFFLATSLLSALQFRFQARHGKDDYRGAAQAALETLQRGGTVWWAADQAAAAYYGLVDLSVDRTPTKSETSKRNFFPVFRPIRDQLTAFPSPDLICLSKKDVYDPHEAVTDYAARSALNETRTLQAFSIFSRAGETLRPRDMLPPGSLMSSENSR
jgi:hypothetical protein